MADGGTERFFDTKGTNLMSGSKYISTVYGSM